MTSIKLKEKYVSFTGLVSVGEKAIFLVIDKFGYPFDIKELVQSCIHFSTVVIESYNCDTFYEKVEIVKFIKKLKNENKNINIILYTPGTIKPAGLSVVDIQYIVGIELAHTNKDLQQRINPSAINYFLEAGAKFYMYIESIDEIDEAILLANDNNIPRSQMYISFDNPELTDEVLDICKLNNINFAPNLKKMFWNELGRL
jgi:hypothetical protein